MFGTPKSNQSGKEPYLIETTRPPFEIHDAGKHTRPMLAKFAERRRCAETFLPRTVIHLLYVLQRTAQEFNYGCVNTDLCL